MQSTSSPSRQVDGRRDAHGEPQAHREMDEMLQSGEPRESLRLDVVALAAELATVAVLIGEELSGAAESSAREISDECAAIRGSANRFLGPSADFNALSNADLDTAASDLREKRRRLMDLWSRSKGLLRRHVPAGRTR